MNITQKHKRVMIILIILICLCFLILPESRIFSRPEKPAAPTETEAPVTLETLLGEDYVQFLTDTITMQMGNRTDKNAEIRYYPIAEKAPLSDYVTIGEETQFEVDAEGYLTVIFPAGVVTEPVHGEQRFRIMRIEERGVGA